MILKNYQPFVLLLILLVLPAMSIHLKETVNTLGSKDAFLKDSYNYFVTDSGNTVWAGALTLAWHELTDSIIKEDIKLDSKDQVVNKIVANFNKSPFTKESLSQKDYYIKSGYGQKTVTTINTEVKKKFPQRSFPDIDASLGDKDIISYAYLAKAFKYQVKFTVKDDFEFKKSTVKGFRAANQEQREQVGYFYYENKNQFLVKLDTKQQNEGVYLLRTNYKSAKVEDIINQVNKWEKETLYKMSSHDYFSMPVVDLDYYRDLSQIQNIKLLNEKFKEYIFAKVYEGLKLKIDESGVKVENQGAIIMKETSSPYMQEIQPKYFVFDDTFWIVLKEKNKSPYLCVKINSPVQKQSL